MEKTAKQLILKVCGHKAAEKSGGKKWRKKVAKNVTKKTQKNHAILDAMQPDVPFEMKLPQTVPLSYGALIKEQFNEEMEKGMADIEAGRVYSADAVEAEMKRDFGV